MKSSGEESNNDDSEPEMFDNVLEKTGDGPKMIDANELTQSEEEEETPIKKPAPPKRKLGPKPAAAAGASKRKIESSESESSPVKKKV